MEKNRSRKKSDSKTFTELKGQEAIKRWSRYDWIFTEKEEKTFREVENLWEVVGGVIHRSRHQHTHTHSPCFLKWVLFHCWQIQLISVLRFMAQLWYLKWHYSLYVAEPLFLCWEAVTKDVDTRRFVTQMWCICTVTVNSSVYESASVVSGSRLIHTHSGRFCFSVCVCCVCKESLSVLCASAVHMRWLLPWELRCIFIFFLGKL